MTTPATPFDVVRSGRRVPRAAKQHLVAVSRAVEARAAGAAGPVGVWACLQRAEFLTPTTRRVYMGLAEAGASVALYGAGVPEHQRDLGAIRCFDLAHTSPLVLEWHVFLLTRDEGYGLAARECGSERPGFGPVEDSRRRFSWVASDDRLTVSRAVQALENLTDSTLRLQSPMTL